MNHSFNIQVAAKVGVEESIVLENIRFWVAKNKANSKHFYNGEYWTYNSVKAFSELFPYWSSRQIERILKSLESQELILVGNFNQSAYDRTKWYALTKKCYSIYANGEMEIHETQNGNTENVEPIPDINTNINSDNKPNIISASHESDKKNDKTLKQEFEEIDREIDRALDKPLKGVKLTSRFQVPTVEEIKAYCLERKNNIDAESFHDFYEARGWMLGKQKMKDWRAAVRTWEKNKINKTPEKKPYVHEKVF